MVKAASHFDKLARKQRDSTRSEESVSHQKSDDEPSEENGSIDSTEQQKADENGEDEKLATNYVDPMIAKLNATNVSKITFRYFYLC